MKNPVTTFICSLVPSGKVAGFQGSIGGTGSIVAGGGVVQNYKSGQMTAFGFGGFEGGWNGGLSGSVFAGFVWNGAGSLSNSNANYSGDSLVGSESAGPVGVTGAPGSGLVTVAATAGGSVTNITRTAGKVVTTPVVQLEKVPPASAMDQAITLFNLICAAI